MRSTNHELMYIKNFGTYQPRFDTVGRLINVQYMDFQQNINFCGVLPMHRILVS